MNNTPGPTTAPISPTKVGSRNLSLNLNKVNTHVSPLQKILEGMLHNPRNLTGLNQVVEFNLHVLCATNLFKNLDSLPVATPTPLGCSVFPVENNRRWTSKGRE
jgi:hypothetical protein